uniref:Uncharacterized protein n=1 Tax=Glossina pallidipes TaxID=7398 RepID=A0A1B0AD82_GLOPL
MYNKLLKSVLLLWIIVCLCCQALEEVQASLYGIDETVKTLLPDLNSVTFEVMLVGMVNNNFDLTFLLFLKFRTLIIKQSIDAAQSPGAARFSRRDERGRLSKRIQDHLVDSFCNLSIEEAMQLARRVKSRQLGISLLTKEQLENMAKRVQENA